MPSEEEKRPRCGVIGVACRRGQPKNGTQLAPASFRQAGFIDSLDRLGYEVADYGDFYDEPVTCKEEPLWYKAKNSMTVGSCAEKVSETVKMALNENDLVINLGGDHSMAYGTLQGALKANPDVCLIWVDAHGDLNLPFTTPSGNMHGMPVGIHLRELSESVEEMPECFSKWFDHRISSKNVAHFGLRDLDDDEKRIIKHLKMASFTAHEIEKHTIAACLKKGLQLVNPNMDRPIHLSFDIDAIDPAFAPSTGTAVPGGLSIREGLYICEELRKTGLLRSVDLAEVNPLIGTKEDAEKTLKTAMLLLEACAGDVRDLSVTPQHWLNRYAVRPRHHQCHHHNNNKHDRA